MFPLADLGQREVWNPLKASHTHAWSLEPWKAQTAEGWKSWEPLSMLLYVHGLSPHGLSSMVVQSS